MKLSAAIIPGDLSLEECKAIADRRANFRRKEVWVVELNITGRPEIMTPAQAIPLGLEPLHRAGTQYSKVKLSPLEVQKAYVIQELAGETPKGTPCDVRAIHEPMRAIKYGGKRSAIAAAWDAVPTWVKNTLEVVIFLVLFFALFRCLPALK